ncbi:hypothetical protein [Alkalilacustris brevis]|uniref:hypothetical protein n=1 Tax=Alkalilacustris brevis TaxID=2026338 RepID=UPI000E0CD228|nr:hypothetical protein [Alkalilacustris brevis]
MRKTLILAALAAFTLPIAPAVLQAGPIETACNRSDRSAANPALCRCIQSIANQTLTRADQRQAARFFRDPQRAQDARMSRSSRDNEFWARYRAFGTAAEARCRS